MTVSPKSACIGIGRQMHLADTIEHDGEVLIVVQWYGNTDEGLRRPEYVLPLSKLKHQDLGETAHPFRYGINEPLPGSLFDGSASRNERRQYGVQKGPDVTYPLEPTSN